MEKRAEHHNLGCVVHKDANCNGALEIVSLNSQSDAHECRNPSVNGFRSVNCFNIVAGGR